MVGDQQLPIKKITSVVTPLCQTLVFERVERFLSTLPRCQVLGSQVISADVNGMTRGLPYSEKIIGDLLAKPLARRGRMKNRRVADREGKPLKSRT
jgi:hypothetical protein